MKVRAETRDLANLKWALEVACLWWEPEQMSGIQKVLHWLNMMNFTMFTLLINMALARIPVVAILYKPYAPLTLWYNAMYFSVVFLQYKSRQIILFHRGMVKLLARYSSEEQMDRFIYLTGIVWRFAFFMAASLISGICIQSLPIFIDILLALFTDSDIFYVPFLMEGFLPEKKERSIWLSVLNFFNVVTQIGPLTYFACYIIMLPAVVSLVYFVLEVVENKLRLWDSLSPQHPERKAIFRELVEEHVEALRLLELMRSVFAPCYCMQCVLLSYNVGYFAHSAKMAMKRSDVGVAVTEIYMATISVIGVVISNAIGQILFEKGLEVSHSIYNLNWMAKSTAEQHDLQMVMRKAQIPVVIAFKNTLPLNFYTLTDAKNLVSVNVAGNMLSHNQQDSAAAKRESGIAFYIK